MAVVIRRLLRSRYVRMLEEDVTRLRAENRALMNSLLGTAGFPPLEFTEPLRPVELPRVRRRSWQQVQMKKQVDAGQA